MVVVPTAWWHATCNLAEWTIGIGAQDSCGLVVCNRDGVERFCGTEKSSELHGCWTDESAHWKRDKDQIQMLRTKGRAYQKLPDAVIYSRDQRKEMGLSAEPYEA